MKLLQEYILSSKAERQAHLDLSEACLERGGKSTHHKGVLAEFLNTDLPSSSKIHLCHACHNGKCSNPRHLYWGTSSENIADARQNGTWKPAWQRMVEKYGYDEACRMNKARGFK